MVTVQKYKAIVEANKEVIKDENKIFPGQKFVSRKVYNQIERAKLVESLALFVGGVRLKMDIEWQGGIHNLQL